ncbi:MAG: sigma-70 family RNA polymerase sigma factor [Oligosphaeraceae bacterium]|nr:sigma-70 family RNA polymerase sigma factor [Oligosphaeraceae bacterium]
MSNEVLPDDNSLIDRFINHGDQEAFALLVEKHSSRAYQIAYGILANREDAEEVAQDAFLRIYRALQNFRGDSEFSTWMYRIVINLARNKHRWHKIRGRGQELSINAPVENARNDGEMAIDLPDERLSPDRELIYEELKAKTREAMENLPESYRLAVTLRNLKELSYEEIAKILHCKVGTIKSKIARGREELKNRLAL